MKIFTKKQATLLSVLCLIFAISCTMFGVLNAPKTAYAETATVNNYVAVTVDVDAIDGDGFIVYATAEDKTYGWCEEPTNGFYGRFVNNNGKYLLYFKLRTNGSSSNSEAWGHGIEVVAEAGEIKVELIKQEDGTAKILINGTNYFTTHFASSVFDSIKNTGGNTYVSIVNGGLTSATVTKVATSEETDAPVVEDKGIAVNDYFTITVDVKAIDGEGFIVYASAEDKTYGWCEEPNNGLFARFVNNNGKYLLYFKLRTNGGSASSEAWGHGIEVAAEAGEINLEIVKEANGTAKLLINGVNYFTDHFVSSVFDSIKNANGKTYVSIVNGGATNATIKGASAEKPVVDTGIAVNDYFAITVDVKAIDGEGFIVYASAEDKTYGWCEEPNNGLFARFVNNNGKYLLYFKLRTNGGSASSEAWGHGIEVVAEAGEIKVELIKQEDGTAKILINETNYFTTHFVSSVFDSIKNANGKTYVSIVNGGATNATVESTSTNKPYIPNSNENWSDIYSESEDVTVLANGAYYKHGLNIEGGHIQVNLSIEKFTLNTGSRIGFAFMSMPNNIYGATYQFETTITATGFIMWFTPNANGTMTVNMLNVETGRFDFMALGDSSNYSTTGNFKIDIYRKGINNISLFFNDVEYTKSSINDVHYEDLIDENGYTYFSYDSYSESGDAIDNTVIHVYEVKDEFVNIEVADFSKTAVKGRAVKLPKGRVDGLADNVSVKVYFGETEVAVDNWTFTPAEVGNYTIVYVYENEGVSAERSFVVSVVDSALSIENSNLYNASNWVVGGGNVESSANGAIVSGTLGYQYYNAPLLMDSGYLGISFEINALTVNSEYDQWVMLALVTGGTFTSPAGFAADGLYFWFTNNSGYLTVNAAYKTAIGIDYLMQETTTLSTMGAHTIGVMVDGEGVRLFVDTLEITGEAVNRMYASDIVNSNNCTYLSITEYSEDGTPTDAEICITGITDINDRDITAPVVDKSGIVTSATVGEEIAVTATATDDVDGEVFVSVSVIDPNGEYISVINDKFIPEKAGEYVVIFTAVDMAGNMTEERAQITVNPAPEKPADNGCIANANSYFVALSLLMLAVGALTVCKRTAKENK